MAAEANTIVVLHLQDSKGRNIDTSDTPAHIYTPSGQGSSAADYKWCLNWSQNAVSPTSSTALGSYSSVSNTTTSLSTTTLSKFSDTSSTNAAQYAFNDSGHATAAASALAGIFFVVVMILATMLYRLKKQYAALETQMSERYRVEANLEKLGTSLATASRNNLLSASEAEYILQMSSPASSSASPIDAPLQRLPFLRPRRDLSSLRPLSLGSNGSHDPFADGHSDNGSHASGSTRLSDRHRFSTMSALADIADEHMERNETKESVKQNISDEALTPRPGNVFGRLSRDSFGAHSLYSEAPSDTSGVSNTLSHGARSTGGVSAVSNEYYHRTQTRTIKPVVTL